MTLVGLDPDLLRIEARRFLEVAKESQSIADEYLEIGRLGEIEEFTNITVKQLEEVHGELTEAANFMLRKCDEMEALFAPGGALSGGLGQPPIPARTSQIPATLALRFQRSTYPTQMNSEVPANRYTSTVDGFSKAIAAKQLEVAAKILDDLKATRTDKDTSNDVSKKAILKCEKSLRDAVLDASPAESKALSKPETLVKLIINIGDDSDVRYAEFKAISKIFDSMPSPLWPPAILASIDPDSLARLLNELQEKSLMTTPEGMQAKALNEKIASIFKSDIAIAAQILTDLKATRTDKNKTNNASNAVIMKYGKLLRDEILATSPEKLRTLPDPGKIAKLIIDLGEDSELSNDDIKALNKLLDATATKKSVLGQLGPETLARLYKGLGSNLRDGNPYAVAIDGSNKLLATISTLATKGDKKLLLDVVARLDVKDLGVMFGDAYDWPPEVLAAAAEKVLLSPGTEQYTEYRKIDGQNGFVSPRTAILKALTKNKTASDLYVFGNAGKFDKTEAWKRAQNLVLEGPTEYQTRFIMHGTTYSDGPAERKLASDVLRLAIQTHERKLPHDSPESENSASEVSTLLDMAMSSPEQGATAYNEQTGTWDRTSGEGTVALAYLFNTVLFDPDYGPDLASLFTSGDGLDKMERFLGNIAENKNAYKLLMVGVANYVQTTPYKVLRDNPVSPATVAGGILAAVREKAIENNEENAATAQLIFSIAFGTATAGIGTAPVFSAVANWMLESATEFAIEASNEAGSRIGAAAVEDNLSPYNQVTKSLNAQMAAALFKQTDPKTKQMITGYAKDVKGIDEGGDNSIRNRFLKDGDLVPPVENEKMPNGKVATAADQHDFGILIVKAIKGNEREAIVGSEFQKLTIAISNFNATVTGATVHTKKGK